MPTGINGLTPTKNLATMKLFMYQLNKTKFLLYQTLLIVVQGQHPILVEIHCVEHDHIPHKYYRDFHFRFLILRGNYVKLKPRAAPHVTDTIILHGKILRILSCAFNFFRFKIRI